MKETPSQTTSVLAKEPAKDKTIKSQAVEMLSRGLHPEVVARALHVSTQYVGQIRDRWRRWGFPLPPHQSYDRRTRAFRETHQTGTVVPKENQMAEQTSQSQPQSQLKRPSLSSVMKAVEADDYRGWCLGCGRSVRGVEPDAREYKCEKCGRPQVYGAEEILIQELYK